MSEKRKPFLILLLKFQGKPSWKLEIFRAADFKHVSQSYRQSNRYRLRNNGKWHGGKGKEAYFCTWYELRDMIWRVLTQGRCLW